MDKLSKEQRRRCMSRVRGKNTKPETKLRKALWASGYRYRIHAKLPGKPDIVFPGLRTAIFVDGCFWHGCPKHSSIPKTNTEFWRRKISRNMERDRENNSALKAMGWTVMRVWEHEVKESIEQIVAKVRVISS